MTDMERTAVSVSEGEDEPTGRLGATRRAIVRSPPWLRIAVAGYGVVALFGFAYLVASLGWEDLSAGARTAVAALVAAPVALGLLWPRLTGLRVLGIEVSLAQVTVDVDTKLAAVITSRDVGSAAPHLVQQMATIVQSGFELLEVDLRDGSYWWSTRLYLLAALAQDLSDVRGFVFVSGGADRRFVGIVAPGIVRRALAAQTPELETTYMDVARPAPLADASSRVSQIVFSWTARSFGPQATVPEGDFATRVSPETLRAAIAASGRRLRTDSVDWPGYGQPETVRALVREFDGEYVALLREGSLDRIVNRFALATRIAAKAA